MTRAVTEKHIINFLALIYYLSLQSDKTKDQNGTTGDKKIGELKTEPKKEEKKKVFLKFTDNLIIFYYNTVCTIHPFFGKVLSNLPNCK